MLEDLKLKANSLRILWLRVQYQQQCPFLPDHCLVQTGFFHFSLGHTAVCDSHPVKQIMTGKLLENVEEFENRSQAVP